MWFSRVKEQVQLMSLMCQGEVFFGRAVGGRSTIDQSGDAKKGPGQLFFRVRESVSWLRTSV